MTNIEFLVNELQKANEKIDNLRKENEKVKLVNRNLMEQNKHLASCIRKLKLTSRGQVNDVSLGDIDALALLKKQLEEG